MVTKIKQTGIADLAVGQGQLAANSVTSAKIVDGAVGSPEIEDASVALGDLSAGVQASLAAGTQKQSGDVVQTIVGTNAVMSTGTTQVPLDDTIPQQTEGNEYLTATITPTSAANRLRIQAVLMIGATAATHVTVCLFQDAVANALAANRMFVDTASGGGQLIIDYTMLAGTTSATTFKVRAGPNNAVTLTCNGSAGARLYGGVCISSIVITELKA